jgi:hypothetical protein
MERPEFAIARGKQKWPQIAGIFEGRFDLFIRAHSDYIRDTVRHVLDWSPVAAIRSCIHIMMAVIQLNIGRPALAYYRKSLMKECGAEKRHDPEVD